MYRRVCSKHFGKAEVCDSVATSFKGACKISHFDKVSVKNKRASDKYKQCSPPSFDPTIISTSRRRAMKKGKLSTQVFVVSGNVVICQPPISFSVDKTG